MDPNFRSTKESVFEPTHWFQGWAEFVRLILASQVHSVRLNLQENLLSFRPEYQREMSSVRNICFCLTKHLGFFLWLTELPPEWHIHTERVVPPVVTGIMQITGRNYNNCSLREFLAYLEYCRVLNSRWPKLGLRRYASSRDAVVWMTQKNLFLRVWHFWISKRHTTRF